MFKYNSSVLLLMKKKVEMWEIFATVVLSVFVFLFLTWASTIMLPLLPIKTNVFFVGVIVILIWTLFVVYLWSILKNAKK